MASQRLNRIVELMTGGSLSEAQDLINLELTERAENVKVQLKESVVANLFEANIVKKTKIGTVTLKDIADYDAVVELDVSGLNADQVRVKAAEFGKFLDTASPSTKYEAIPKGANEFGIKFDGQIQYEIQYKNDKLIYDGSGMHPSDVSYFKKTGKFAPL